MSLKALKKLLASMEEALDKLTGETPTSQSTFKENLANLFCKIKRDKNV